MNIKPKSANDIGMIYYFTKKQEIFLFACKTYKHKQPNKMKEYVTTIDVLTKIFLRKSVNVSPYIL